MSELALLASLRSALDTEHNVRFALLFGSAARGTDTADSDVDLLVDLCDARFERVIDLSTKLARLLGRHVDVVELGDAEREPAFLAQLIDEGRVLVDREGVWPRLLERADELRNRGRREEAEKLRAALAGIDRLLASRRGGVLGGPSQGNAQNGASVGELRPLPRRQFVPAEVALAAFKHTGRIDCRRFRADVDQVIDQDPSPRVASIDAEAAADAVHEVE